jgi:kojibiose phosphorylase
MRHTFDLRAHAGLPRIQAVVFDLDGVLTSTSEYHYLAWKQLADEERIPFDREANEALRGVSRRESLLRLLDGRSVSEAQMAEMMARKNRYYQAYLTRITRDDLLPGALELIHDLRRSGIAVGVGSTSRNARAVVDRLRITQLIDALSDGHSVSRQKPAPDLFLHVAAQLGVRTDECVIIEDAASGIDAALEADTWTVGLGPAARVGHAHVVLSSLDGVRWSWLLARLRAAAAL